ncbi:hypothetical protein EUX98_g9501 [Antrodiella citrinella]|uniref:Helicase ATP-binding domain-containing protein n=1 Tax=Antrodiella citrinella TaxID=2447956 RepID=A0A4S4LXW7_9APHY|nr:hypothetical protein EUX98_g9501 [Antrodiella citrinella]
MAIESTAKSTPPTIEEIRAECSRVFGVRACLWQAQFTEAILKRDTDVVLNVGTGMGKTLAFWLPLLFKKDGIQIVVTALNILGKQNVDSLKRAGISAVDINSENATAQNFRDIADGVHCIVVVSPEQLMKPGGEFEKLFKNPTFASRIVSVIFDEAHCISQWGTFRPEYKEIERLRYILPKDTLIAVASATFSDKILSDIKHTLHLRKDRLTYITRSNDRPNVQIVVRKIQHAMDSFRDLDFLIPAGWMAGDAEPPKFLIFFDNRLETVRAGRYLHNCLPSEYRDKIVWLISDMSKEFKEQQVEKLKKGELWGLCATDSFGMVSVR